MEENQLQKTTNSLSTQKAHVLLNPPAFKEDYNKVYNTTLAAVAKSFADLNFAVPGKKDVDMMVSELTKNIQENHKQLRVEEIRTAFANGIRKEYGEYMGLSVVTFDMFIKGYLNSRQRADLAKSIPVIETTSEPTDEQKFQLASGNAFKAFQDYQLGKDITLVAPVVYRFLNRLKIVQYTEEEKAEFLAEAQKEVIENLTKQKAVMLDKIKRLEIARQLEKPQTLDQKIILQAQRLGLYAFFQEVIMEETDLKTLINSKKTHI